MSKKSTARKIHDRVLKIMHWQCKAEDACDRKEAQKALRKVAKHSLKLAKLESEAYYERVHKEVHL